MSQLSRPLPALYVVYILRSTVRHASLYIGSTPNPPRRLKQHNGESQGGARRTARSTLRPWEMVAVVSGFPSSVAALKFEWALTNPHLSLHIPDEARVTISSQKKRNGQPKRPSTSLRSIISNLRILTSVPSFDRWPLKLHFFRKEVHTAWKSCEKAAEVAAAAMTAVDGGAATTSHNLLPILEDYGPPPPQDGGEASVADTRPWGIHALPLDYRTIKSYVEKVHNVVEFEQDKSCVHCQEELVHSQGLHPMCPNGDCEAMGHLDCWAEHALGGEERASNDEVLIPKGCTCPSCGGRIVWADMMTELSLRTRGPAEVEKLLKKGRKAKEKEKAKEKGK